MVMETVDYIKRLQNKIKELQKKVKEPLRESTPQTWQEMGRDTVPKITLHYHPTESDSEKTLANTLMEIEASDPMSSEITQAGASESTVKSLRDKVLSNLMVKGAVDATPQSLPVASSPMDETVQTTSEEIPDLLIVSAEEEEIPEFNSVEDLRQWLGL
jgi:hypothetical protein